MSGRGIKRQWGEMVRKKTESRNFWDFFQTTKNYNFSLYPLLTFFNHQGSANSFRGLKATCISPALSKFHPSVKDGATY
jgi:hypothetical protein